MRKLIEYGIEDLEFSILKANTANSIRMLNTVPTKKQSGLAAALYAGNNQAKRTLRAERRQRTLRS